MKVRDKAHLALGDVLLERDLIFAEYAGIEVRDSSEQVLNAALPPTGRRRGILKCIVDGERLTLESYIIVKGRPDTLDVRYVNLGVPIDTWRHWHQRLVVLRAIKRLVREAP